MKNFTKINKNIVFITIVTYNRQPILINNIELLKFSLKSVKYNCKIIAGIVLPDHIHLLIQADNATTYPKIIATFKANFSKLLPKNQNQTQFQSKPNAISIKTKRKRNMAKKILRPYYKR